MFYKRSDQVVMKKIGNSTALYSGKQKAIHIPNETALFVWDLLETPFTADELLYMLIEVFDGDPAEMKEDLRELLDLFLRYDLIHREA